MSWQRINVIGTAGSGKTTLARELARRLDLPHYEMDAMFWKPGWQESTDAELLGRVREVTSQARWVLDGNYTRTLPMKWERVQLVIWLDPAFVPTIWRVIARTLRRAVTREELWPGTGNRESLTEAFLSKKSIIWAELARRDGAVSSEPAGRYCASTSVVSFCGSASSSRLEPE